MSPSAPRMLTLTTLGGLALASEAGVPSSVGGQRRPLALLAILAAAGGAGVTRERLVGLLWPDADPERARRSLAQAVYTLRRATGEDDLVTGATELRLDLTRIASDLAAFEGALAAGRIGDAIAAYRGPFLDGFYVPGSVDFDRWVDAERERIGRRYVDALTTLARGAERAGDLQAAASWHRRLVAADPLDSSAALALVDALARAGDVAGALRAASIHEALLAEQLALPLPEPLRARVASLRAGHTSGEHEAPWPDALWSAARVPHRTVGQSTVAAPGGASVLTLAEALMPMLQAA